jgi:tryptophanyl-tRNA synthetase
MDADILMFKSNVVPVGKDQKQHVEFSRDIAERFNKQYGTDIFVLPEPLIQKETDVIPGLDGRKMSKSYGNTIEIFLEPKELKAKIGKIVTNSQAMEEPKDPDKCNVFALYKLFASEEQTDALAARYRAGGMGWGHAKEALRELLEEHLAGPREKYNSLLADTAQIDKILAYGAEKARAVSKPFMDEIRAVVGIGEGVYPNSIDFTVM